MSIPNRRYGERRGFHRMTINSEITFAVNGAENIFKGFCMNLSHSGILFETKEPLSTSQSLNITIDTGSSRFKPLKAAVNIIRVEQTADERYAVAGEIIEFK